MNLLPRKLRLRLADATEELVEYLRREDEENPLPPSVEGSGVGGTWHARGFPDIVKRSLIAGTGELWATLVGGPVDLPRKFEEAELLTQLEGWREHDAPDYPAGGLTYGLDDFTFPSVSAGSRPILGVLVYWRRLHTVEPDYRSWPLWLFWFDGPVHPTGCEIRIVGDFSAFIR